MNGLMRSPFVVLDTNAWSRLFIARDTSDDRGHEWRSALLGKTVVIATQTRAELLSGAAVAGWDRRRLHHLRRQLAQTPTVPVLEAVTEAWVTLRSACRRHDHPLGERAQVAEAWVAATAISISAPLLAADPVYELTPGLILL